MAHDLSRGISGTRPSGPSESIGTLGKFGSYWMPKSPREIIQRTGAEHSPRSGEGSKRSEGKADTRGRTNAKTSFGDLIRNKQDARVPNPPETRPDLPAKANARTVRPKDSRPQSPPPLSRSAARLPAATPLISSAKTTSPERVVAEKPSSLSSSRRDLQDVLKSAKEQKNRDMHHEQEHDDQNKRDHGAENARHGRTSTLRDELPETNQKTMNAASRDTEETVHSRRNDSDSRSTLSVGSPREIASGCPSAPFLRSDEKSQRDARRPLELVRRRIGDFIDGDARVARLAIDLPGGGRLGIKMRFVGNQLEVIFATENPALRAALLEGWKHLALGMGPAGSRLLPPAFANEHYEGIIRSDLSEAA